MSKPAPSSIWETTTQRHAMNELQAVACSIPFPRITACCGSLSKSSSIFRSWPSIDYTSHRIVRSWMGPQQEANRPCNRRASNGAAAALLRNSVVLKLISPGSCPLQWGRHSVGPREDHLRFNGAAAALLRNLGLPRDNRSHGKCFNGAAAAMLRNSEDRHSSRCPNIELQWGRSSAAAEFQQRCSKSLCRSCFNGAAAALLRN